MKKYSWALVMTICGIICCGYRLLYLTSELPDYLIMGTYFILVWLIHIFKVMRVSYAIELIYYLFLFLAMLLGSIAEFYDLISWWDVLAHTMWGYIAGYFGIFFLCKLRSEKQNHIMIALFCFITSMACASLWEVFEFLSDRIFDLNVQHWQDTGLYDTMYDIICNLGGAFLFVIHYYIDVRYYQNLFFKNVFHDLIRTPKIPVNNSQINK